MRLGVPAALIMVGVSIAAPAHADAERTTTLAVGAGVAAYSGADEIFDEDQEIAGLHLAATLAWDREPPAYRTDGGWSARGDLVPELTLARFSGRSLAVLGLRLELDYAKPDTYNWSRERSSVWLSPKLGVLSGADSAVVGLELGMSNQVRDTGWSYGLVWSVLTWNEQRPGPVPLVAAGSPGPMQPDDRERMVALTFGLALARAYD